MPSTVQNFFDSPGMAQGQVWRQELVANTVETSDSSLNRFQSDWEEMHQIYSAGDHQGAIFRLKKMAKKGCGPAFAAIGGIYERGGNDIERSPELAIEWYKKSVEAVDDVESHLGLARVYLTNPEFDTERTLAPYHLSLAADSGIMGGYYGLGLLHETGLGVTKDIDLAYDLYRKAKALGHVTASLRCARIEMKKTPFVGAGKLVIGAIRFLSLYMRNSNNPRLVI